MPPPPILLSPFLKEDDIFNSLQLQSRAGQGALFFSVRAASKSIESAGSQK